MHNPRAAAPATLAFAWLGGVLFVAALIEGGVAYAVRFGEAVPAGRTVTGIASAAIDTLLFSGFALHHSVFARGGIKARVNRIVGPDLERSVYVWIASALFLGVCAAWRDVPGVLWTSSGPLHAALVTVQLLGVGLSGYASRQLDVLSLAGIRQARHDVRGRPVLVARGLYGFVRHPIYFAWLLMVWPAPVMTGTRLVFAAVSTAYLVLAIPIEERALRREFGPHYGRYACAVRWRLLPGVY
jgi:protein-S-isoprenylcysteine O-methyltransferase Ste14